MLAFSCVCLSVCVILQQIQIRSLCRKLSSIADVAASLEVPSDGR